MSKAFFVVAAMVLSGSIATVAEAQPGANEDVTEHNFLDADRVEGDRETSWGDRLRVRRGRDRGSLIRIRDNFVHEALKSVENI